MELRQKWHFSIQRILGRISWDFVITFYTIEGGTHITGFKTKFTTIMNQYAREIGVLKRKRFKFYRNRCEKWYDSDRFRQTSRTKI